jgi:3-oxoadipate CoA-transferase alpha subunit
MLTFVDTVNEAVAGIKDGSTVMIGGFGNAGQPFELIDALMDCGAKDLTVVNNNAGQGDQGLALLIKEGRVKKMICSFPRQSDSWHFDAKYHAGEIELELVPQGNLAERKPSSNSLTSAADSVRGSRRITRPSSVETASRVVRPAGIRAPP